MAQNIIRTTNQLSPLKPRILILTDPFGAPAYNPRLRTVCDYLAARGWVVDVYTERGSLCFSHAYPIHEIAIYNTTSSLEWACKSLWSLLFDWRNRYFSQAVRKAISQRTYDCIFCCTFSTFPLRAALDIAQERHLPLHVDLRDIDEQVPGAQYQNHRQWWLRPFRNWYKQVNIQRRNIVLRQAQSITSVSPWHVNFLKQFNNNTHLIYNGFDTNIFNPKDCATQHFTIAYVGRIYEQQMQDPTLLMKALQTLQLDIRISWYTNPEGQQRIRRMATDYGVEHLMNYHAYVPLEHVPEILRQASILLVLSNKATTSGAHGIMTTKFFEALGVEKPVLCVRSDEECLANVINQTNAGLAATNVEEIQTFICEKYHEWQQNGFTRQAVINKEQFSREKQAQQFEQLFIHTLKSHNY